MIIGEYTISCIYDAVTPYSTPHYLATPLSAGVTTSTPGWSRVPQELTAENKYLWVYYTTHSGLGDEEPQLIEVYNEGFTYSGEEVPLNDVTVDIDPKLDGWHEVEVSNAGFNIWDEEWELGYINTDTGLKEASSNAIRAKNYIPISPNTPYYFKCPSVSNLYARLFWYDGNHNFISYVNAVYNIAKTSPENAHYALFMMTAPYGTTYNNDICFNLSDVSKNGTYAPYNGGATHTTSFKDIQVEVGTDKEPYKFRKVSGKLNEASNKLTDKLVGGSVNFNQLINNNNFSNTTGIGTHACTISVSDNICESTLTDVSELAYVSVPTGPRINGHKYLMLYEVKGSKALSYSSIVSLQWGTSSTGVKTNDITTSWTTVCGIFANTVDASAATLYLRTTGVLSNAGFSVGDKIYYKNVRIIDITHYFGSFIIADYAYSLEQSNAGSGVNWLSQYIDLSKIYPYNLGEIKSVEGLQSHDFVGFNQWDEEWEVGYIDQGTPTTSLTTMRSKNFCNCLPNTDYYVGCQQESMSQETNIRYYLRIIFYDADKNFISHSWENRRIITSPKNARYFKICTNPSGQIYGTTYLGDICINISDPAKNGTYEPYHKNSYTLDSNIKLQGIFRLVNDHIESDGDIYEDDGKATRKYKIVDLATLTWLGPSSTATADGTPCYRAVISDMDTTVANTDLLAEKYVLASGKYIANMTNGTIIRGDGMVYVATSEAKTGLLLYPVATPYIESATPYSSTQYPFANGTEEYVTTGLVPVGHETTYYDGRVYGGELDVGTGKLTSSFNRIDLGSLNWTKNDHNTLGTYYYAMFNDIKYSGTYFNISYPLLVDGYTTTPRNTTDFLDKCIAADGSDGNVTQIQIKDSSYNNATTFKAAMSGVMLIYESKEPIIYQLTPEEVNAIVGDNYVLANTGKVKVGYYNNQKVSEDPYIIGTYGERGISVVSTSEEWTKSSSSTSIPSDAVWTETEPEITAGEYLWGRLRTEMSDGSVQYSDAVYRMTISGIVSDVDQVNQKITNKIWQSDINTSINSYDGSTVANIRNRVSQTEQDITGITSRVSDVESDTTSLGTRMTSAESSITQNANNIALKVNKDGVISEINQSPESITINANRVDTLFTSGRLSQTSLNNAYDSNGSASAVQTNLDNLEIGGRNLLKWTGNFDKAMTVWSKWLTANVMERTTDGIKFTFASTEGGIIVPLTYDNAVEGTEELTLSFQYRTNKTNWGPLYLLCTPNPNVSLSPFGSMTVSETNWVKYSKTFSFPTHADRVAKSILIAYTTNSSYWFEIKEGSLKLEKGGKATSWTPAPEDIDANISTAQTTANTAVTNAATAQSTADKNMKTSVQLWFSKANTTAPSAPTSKVTSTATSGNAWTTVVPTYNASYPYYYYCYQYVASDGTVTWSPVVYDQATTETQERARTAITNAATVQTNLDNLEIGGRNYYSYNNTTLATDTGVTANKDASINGIVCSNSTSSAKNLRLNRVINEQGNWTVSFYVKSDSTVKITSDTCDNYADPATVINTTTEYQYFVQTVNVTRTINNTYHFVDINIHGNGGNVYIKDIKVEKGNRATSWTPAIEDLIKETVSCYYRSTTSSTPTISSSTSIGTSNNTDNVWSYVIPLPKRDKYFFTCEKYVYADGSISFSTVRALDSQTYASKWVSSSDQTYIDGGRIYANSVTTAQLATDAIKSTYYQSGPDGSPYSSRGTFLDLSNGDFYTPNFGINAGSAYINGEIVATSGRIGEDTTTAWDIGTYTDGDANDHGAIIGHGDAFIQAGKWMISTDRIDTKWYNNSNNITYIYDTNTYYDYGMNVPDYSKTDTISKSFLYIRKHASTIPLLDDDWEYIFRVERDGTIYVNNTAIAGAGSDYLSKSQGGTVTGNVTITGTLTATASKANQLTHSLSVNGKAFDGSSDVTVGTLGVAYGGTGQTTAQNAANAFINALETGSTTPVDADYIISQYVGGGTTTTRYVRRPMSTLWSYIKPKIIAATDLGYVKKTGDTISGSLTVENGFTSDVIYTGDILVSGAGRFANGLYGDLIGNADTATKAAKVADSNNGTDTTFAYSKAALTSTSDVAVWNGYELRKINPANLYVKGVSITSVANSVAKYSDTSGTLTDSYITIDSSNNLVIGDNDHPGNLKIGAKNDNYGLMPNTNNYNQIGSSSLSWYRAYVTNYFGTTSNVNYWSSGKNIGTASSSSAAATKGTVNFINDCAAGGTQTRTLLSVGSATSNITVTLPSATGTLALLTDNVASAISATNDSDGNVIKDTYLKLAGGTITGNLAVNGTISKGDYHIVDNIASFTKANNSTGTIKITLPFPISNYDMPMFDIYIYEYNSYSASNILIGGHNWPSGNAHTWYQTGYSVLGNYDKGVRLCNDGTNWVILLGTTTTTWNYVSLHLKTIFAEYTQHASDWATGNYSITQITDETGLVEINTPALKTLYPLKDGTGATGTWGIGISGNATTATKFSSAREIKLTGDVTGSASTTGESGWSITTTVADNSHNHRPSNIVPTNDYMTGEIDWIASSKIGSAASNKSFGLPAEAITVEYSTDGGSTWLDYGFSDVQKQNIFNEIGCYTHLGKATTQGANSTNCQLRITIKATDRYVYVKGIYFWMGVNGNTVTVDLDRATRANQTTFSNVFTARPLGGNSGPNIHYFSPMVFGGYTGQDSNWYVYRFTFKQTAISSSASSAGAVSDIRLLGDMVWISPNNMVSRNHMYTWDTNFNVTFPAQVAATAFAGNATSASKLNTAGTIQTNLASTTAVTYTNGGNITPGVTGILGVANGGTGHSNRKDAANDFIKALDTASGTPVDTDYYVSQYANGGTTYTTYYRRPMSALYTYMKGKMDSVYLGISANATSASALSTAGTIQVNLGSTSAVTYTSGGNITPGITGTLPIANGGTGATTALAAYTNLEDRGTATNANDALSRGVYAFTNTATNIPFTDYGTLFNILNSGESHNNSGNWIWQFAVSTGNNNLYLRRKINANAWQSWTTFYSTTNKPTKSDVGLGNVTNNAQVKGLSTGTTSGHLVTWGSDGYTVADSGVALAPSGNTRGLVSGVASDNDGKLVLTYADGSTSSPIAVEFVATQTSSVQKAESLNVNGTAVGSATQPVFFNNQGKPQTANTYAGGTAVTLNGSSKAASTASFYAPTGAGTSGQVLTSSGGAPSWTNQSSLSVGSASSATTATKFSSARSVTLTGDVTGSTSSDGTSGWSIATTVGDDSHNHTRDTIVPKQTKTYTNVVMSANNDPNGWVYFAKFIPTSETVMPYIKYRVITEAAGRTDCYQDSKVEYWMYGPTLLGYSTNNYIKNTSYRAMYNHSLYRATNTGITSGYGHLLGIRFTSSWNPATAANARTVIVEILETRNCTVEFLDTMKKYADISWGNSTNYAGRSDYDGTTQGITISGDRNDVNYQNREYYASRTAYSYIGRYMLVLTRPDSTIVPTVSVDNDVSTTKTYNTTDEFDPFGEIYYFWGGSPLAAGGNVYNGYLTRQVMMDARYAFNVGGNNTTSLVASRHPFYLVATPQSNGMAKIHASGLTQ